MIRARGGAQNDNKKSNHNRHKNKERKGFIQIKTNNGGGEFEDK